MKWKMEFGAPRWFVCKHSLEVVPIDKRGMSESGTPIDWPEPGHGANKRYAMEEVLETILIRNLHVLLQEDIDFLFRGGDYWGIQDIIAMDKLGRFHLFELKRGQVSSVVPEQLGMYLLGNLFLSADHQLEKLWKLNTKDLSPQRWKLYHAAALANERTSNIGPKFVNATHPDIRSGSRSEYLKAEWGQMKGTGRRDQLLIESMLAKAAGRNVTGVSEEMIGLWAQETYDQVTETRPIRPKLRPLNQAVIWLVGKDFDAEVYERVRKWRRAGLDARCLKYEARQSELTGQWVLRTQRELYPERDTALKEIIPEVASLEKTHDIAHLHLEMEFYDTRAPSNTEVHQGGLPLNKKARILACDMDRNHQIDIFPKPGDKQPRS